MRIIADTCIWSLALRRSPASHSAPVDELKALIDDHRVEMLGPIRQGILSGIREQSRFDRLERLLRALPDLPILTQDYAEAARSRNVCRSRGIQGSHTDFLICAVAARTNCAIFTTDQDFEGFATHLPVVLHRSTRA